MTTPGAPPRPRLSRSWAALVVAAVALTGCGDDHTSATPATSTSAAETSSGSVQPSTTPSAPSTPRTPTPPPAPSPTPGAAIAGEAFSAAQLDELQQAVDEGHQPWRLDVAAVAEAFTRDRLGWTDVQVGLADPHTAEVTSGTDGRMVTLQLRQPAREGADGIWIVISDVWLN